MPRPPRACIALSKTAGLYPKALFSPGWPHRAPPVPGGAGRLARIRAARMRHPITPTMRDRKRLLPVAHTPQQRRQVLELLRHHMDDIALALHAPATRHHAG